MKDDISFGFMSTLARGQPSEWRSKSIVIVCATAQSILQTPSTKPSPQQQQQQQKKKKSNQNKKKKETVFSLKKERKKKNKLTNFYKWKKIVKD